MILDYSQNGIVMIFEITEDNTVLLLNFSNKVSELPDDKRKKWCNICDVHISGGNQDDNHGAKHTGHSAIFTHKYVSHNCYENEIGNKLEFLFSDSLTEITVHYQFYKGISALRSWTSVKNISDTNQGLEYVPSFSFTGIGVGDEDISDNLDVYIPHSSWIKEMNWKKNTLSELGFQKDVSFSTKRVMVSNTGTWSSKEHLPLGVIVNNKTDSSIMWQIENNGSWHWEIGDFPSMLYLKVSGPTELENQWHKELLPGETFVGTKACVTVGQSFNDVLCEMTKYRRYVMKNNEENKKLPVIFNDYMHCLWADPTTEKMKPVIDKAAETGAEYYVMDAGWYADGTWWETVGEWQPCEWRFPGGIKEVFDYIKSKGMVPGIWFEIEVMGINCPIIDRFDDSCFFTRHGRRVIDHGRYQLDFRSKKVRDFATAVIERAINDYGVGYIKFDYNIEAGPGTEINSDSFGDGLLGHNRAYLDWINEISQKYPYVILENCSCGGMRLDYAMLSSLHMASISDQELYTDTAYVSSGSSTTVVPEQAGIWSYPKEENNADAVGFNMVNSILQRICLAGEIIKWNDEQFSLVKEAINLYKTYRNEIPSSLPYYPLGIQSYSDDWLCSGFKYENCTRLCVWRMNSDEETLNVPLDFKANDIKILYPSNSDAKATITENGLKIDLMRKYTAVMIEIK